MRRFSKAQLLLIRALKAREATENPWKDRCMKTHMKKDTHTLIHEEAME